MRVELSEPQRLLLRQLLEVYRLNLDSSLKALRAEPALRLVVAEGEETLRQRLDVVGEMELRLT